MTSEEKRKLLKRFVEYLEETLDYLPCENSILIDSFMDEEEI